MLNSLYIPMPVASRIIGGMAWQNFVRKNLHRFSPHAQTALPLSRSERTFFARTVRGLYIATQMASQPVSSVESQTFSDLLHAPNYQHSLVWKCQTLLASLVDFEGSWKALKRSPDSLVCPQHKPRRILTA